MTANSNLVVVAVCRFSLCLTSGHDLTSNNAEFLINLSLATFSYWCHFLRIVL
jgi:hypothetical protein